jgi:hypothetical protein
LRIWHELHGKNPRQRCWAIGFERVVDAPESNPHPSVVAKRERLLLPGLFSP